MIKYTVELEPDEVQVLRGALLTFNSDLEQSKDSIQATIKGMEEMEKEGKEVGEGLMLEYKKELGILEDIHKKLISLDNKLPKVEE